ncbi:outer membrane protein transport protein [Vibrio lamellibrachiae]|uniref:OmpP1/FadL family transporter n=1 Tax=Vibrio lamellibrachiae TaxID=2910253 RepID=UPI003D1243F6
MKKSILTLLICSSFANASGLLLQEAVTANAGTGGAGDGVYTETATASWTNPATMSHMGESKTTINTMALYLQMDYTDYDDIGSYNGNANAETIMPSLGIFHVRQLNEDIHIGVNFGAVGGSSIEYGNSWDGANHLDKAFMSALQINPNLSFQIDDNWSIGLGAQVNFGILEVSTTGFESDMATDWAFGYNMGAMYQAEQWSLGLSYRSKLIHDFDDITATLTSGGELINGRETIVGTELVIPAIIDLSGRYELTTKLDLLSSIQFHQWSEFSETPVYNDPLNRIDPSLAIDRDWDDVWKVAVGADYQLNADWALKAGFSYETSPQDDPTKQWVDLPVGEQYRYSLGASTYWNTTRIDLFYEYADLGSVEIERTASYTEIHGSFEGSIHFIGANFTF